MATKKRLAPPDITEIRRRISRELQIAQGFKVHLLLDWRLSVHTKIAEFSAELWMFIPLDRERERDVLNLDSSGWNFFSFYLFLGGPPILS